MIKFHIASFHENWAYVHFGEILVKSVDVDFICVVFKIDDHEETAFELENLEFGNFLWAEFFEEEVVWSDVFDGVFTPILALICCEHDLKHV